MGSSRGFRSVSLSERTTLTGFELVEPAKKEYQSATGSPECDYQTVRAWGFHATTTETEANE